MNTRIFQVALFQAALMTVPIGFVPLTAAHAQEPSTPAPLSATVALPTGGADVTSTLISAGAGLADARNLASLNAPETSIVEAIARTVENYPQRAAALAALRAAQARIGIARAAGGLQVGLSGNQGLQRDFGSSSNSSSGSFSGGTGSGSSNGSSQNVNQVLGFESTQTLGVDASLPIYSGGRVRAGKRVAEAQARAQAAQTLQTTQDLVRTSIETYLNILRSDQLLEVAQSNLEVSRERSRIANVRFFAGAAARLEVLRADATLADAAQRRVDASSSLAQFKAALNILMGRKPETPLRVMPISTLSPRVPVPQLVNVSATSAATSFEELSTPPGEAVPLAATITPLVNPSNDPLYALAETNRPAGISFEEQLRAAEANIDVAKAAKRPSLGLSLGALLRNPTSFAGRFALSLGLSLAQNLFDSGRSSSQVREARALADQARANRDLSRLQVANQIESALLSLDAAQKRAQLSEIGVVAAREALRAAQLGYQAGASTSLEVSDAQAALLQAQQQAVNARFDVANAQSNLSAAVGVLTVEGQQAYELALQQEMQQEKKRK
jgi:outer membrane protein TolC